MLTKYALIALPIIISVLWHFNNGLPAVADGAAYLQAGMHIANFWLNGDYFAFFDAYFSFRSWRPIAFPNIIAPFIALTNDVLLATSLVHIFCNSLTVFFTYKIFRLSIGKIESAVSTSFICISVSVYFGGLGAPLFSEIAFVPTVLGTLYYLHTSNSFQNKKESIIFSLFLFLCIAIRPAQSIIHILLPLFGYFFYKTYIMEFSLKETSRAISIISFGILIIFLSRVITMLFIEGESNTIYQIDPPKSGDIFIVLTFIIFIINLISFSIYLYCKNKIIETNKNFLLLSISLATVLIFIYWYPFISNLYVWVYANSFGHLVNFYVKPDIGFHMWLKKIVVEGGSFQYILCLILLTITFLKKYLEKFVFKIKNSDNFLSKDINILLLLTIPVPYFTFFSSPQDHFRVVSFATFCALILILIYIFKNNNRNVIFSILLLAVSIKFIAFNKMIYAHENNSSYSTYDGALVESVLGRNMPTPVTLKPHPVFSILDKVNQFVSKKENSYIKNIYKPVSGFERVDTFILSTLSQQNKYKFNISIPIPKKDMIDRDYKDQMTIMESGNAILLTNPAVVGLPLYSLEGKPITSDFKASDDTIRLYKNVIDNTVPQEFKSRINQSVRFHFLVSYLYLTDDLEKYGWKISECFNYNSIDIKNNSIQEKACIAIKVK